MAELPADVTVKSEEAPPAAPASYDGPGPLNEPPPETVAQAAPPPPPADETASNPCAMTPEQAAAAYAPARRPGRLRRGGRGLRGPAGPALSPTAGSQS